MSLSVLSVSLRFVCVVEHVECVVNVVYVSLNILSGLVNGV